jgi:hypothetical protein
MKDKQSMVTSGTCAAKSIIFGIPTDRSVVTGALARDAELMETPQMRSALIFFLASSCFCLAQERSENESAGRMFFPPELKEPAPPPKAVATPPKPAPSPKRETNPSEMVEMFFVALKAGQIDSAYDSLVNGSIIADRREDVQGLKERTKQALDNYGPISGYELVDEKTVGTSLLRRTCISLNTDLPLRWRFYFYRSEDEWKLVDLRVDDGLVELFEEPIRARK